MKLENTIRLTYEDDDGYECEGSLPARFDVCPRCEGHGTHLHDAIGSHAYTVEEFNDSFDDEEREEYFRRGGRYDVTCTECRGARVVSVVDEEACGRASDLAELLERYERAEAEDASYDRLCAAERAAEEGSW